MFFICIFFILCLLSHVTLFILGPEMYDEYTYTISFVFTIIVFTLAIIALIKTKMEKNKFKASVYAEIKTMSFDDMAVFLNSILCCDSLLDDMYCGSCYKKLGYCPVGEGGCEHMDVDVVLWFLSQPYDRLQPMLDDCTKWHDRRDSE